MLLIVYISVQAWALPSPFGVNALCRFVRQVGALEELWKLPRMDGRTGNLQTYIYDLLRFVSRRAGPFSNASSTLLWLGMMAILYQRRLIKVESREVM